MRSNKGLTMSVIKFLYRENLIDTMVFDRQYDAGLTMTVEEKHSLFSKWVIPVWLSIDGELAGETYGIPTMHLDDEIEGVSTKSAFEIYCYSNTVLPKFQWKGFGSILKAHWLGILKQMGALTVIGHARPGSSLAINKKFGADLGPVFDDWYGTGESYTFYRMTL